MSTTASPVVFIVQLDRSYLTENLVDQIKSSFRKTGNHLDFSSIDFETYKEEGISEIDKQIFKDCELITVETHIEPVVILRLGDELTDELMLNLSPADVLIFCGHSEYKGGLTAYITKELVSDLIGLLSPVVVSFFGCDVGRPRDGFIFELSHSHELNKGPIYSAFVKKVTVEQVMHSSVMHGIVQFVAQCCAIDHSREFEDLYNLARCSFASEIARRESGGDSGIFFNDTRKETTSQDFMYLATSERLSVSQQETLRTIGRYHLWTVDLGYAVEKYIEDIGDILNPDTPSTEDLDALLANAMDELQIKSLIELEQLAASLELTRDIIDTFALGGDLAAISSRDLCACIYNGIFGNECFTNIVSLLVNRLLDASDLITFKIIAAVLVLIDETWYVVPNNNGKCVWRQDIGESVKFGTFYNFRCEETTVVSFDTDSFLGPKASLAPLYKHCIRNDVFSTLFNTKNSVPLQCGVSLNNTFRRKMFARKAYNYTSNDFHRMLNAVMCSARQTLQTGIMPDLSHDIITKQFENNESAEQGCNRLKSFPSNVVDEVTYLPIPLQFMEVYTLPGDEWNKLYRCRFIVALPEQLCSEPPATHVSCYVYYTDSHYGQDVYAAGTKNSNEKSGNNSNAGDKKKNNEKPGKNKNPVGNSNSKEQSEYVILDSALGKYNWINECKDYIKQTMNLCNVEKFFPFEYIGNMSFVLNPVDGNDELTFELPDEPNIPNLEDAYI